MTNKHAFRTRTTERTVAVASFFSFFVLVGALSVTLATNCALAKKHDTGGITTRSRDAGSLTALAHVHLAKSGIGFDDLLYAPALGRLLAPAANAGYLALIEPSSRAITRFAAPEYAPKAYGGGHDEGMTSADSDGKWVFAADRTTDTLLTFSVETARVVSRAVLDGNPDYVRYVAATDEVWVTEPDREQIEIFSVPRARDAAPKKVATIKVPGGPESLVVDSPRGRAYTHLWKGKTVSIEVTNRQIAATYSNGCQSSRGIAVDGDANLLFAGCSEGRVTVLDLKQAGKIVAFAPTSPGVDIIAYNPYLHHIYVPSASNGQLAVFAVERSGALRLLGHAQAAAGSHCVASDESANIWVCDPERGELIVFGDTLR